MEGREEKGSGGEGVAGAPVEETGLEQKAEMGLGWGHLGWGRWGSQMAKL